MRAALQSYRPDIDGLRAVAVVAVVLYHLGVPEFKGGFVGVDVFFVISGYLITSIIFRNIEAGAFSIASFYLRRLRRIGPALLAVCAGTALLAPVMLAPVHLQPFGASLVAALTSTSNILFWRENGYFDLASELKPLLHTWSLGVEEQFYLVWPALLLLIGDRRRLALSACLALIIGSFLAAELYLRSDPSAVFFLLPFRLGELATGATLVWLPDHRTAPRWSIALGFIGGCAALAYAITQFTDRTSFPGISAAVPTLATALIITCRPASRLDGVLSNAASVWLGRISYSLYLVHWPVIVFWGYYRYAPMTATDRWCAGIVSFVLAVLLYRLVEQPFRSSVSGRQSVSTKYLVQITGGSAALLVVAGLCIWLGWAPLRIMTDNSTLAQRATSFEKNGPKIVSVQQANVLLIGDSHADHYTEAMLLVSFNAGLSMAHDIKAGCPPLLIYHLGRPLDHVDGYMNDCLNQIKRWKREIKEFPGDTVVLASRWSQLTEPSHYGRYRVRRHWLLIDPDDPNELDATRRRFDNSLRETVDFILSMGKRVVILGQVPETGTDLNACYAAPTWLLPDPTERCISVPSEGMIARLKFDNDLFRTVERQHPDRVLAFIASDALCRFGVCRLSVEGDLIYRNEDHVTPAGSLFLSDFMGQVGRFLKDATNPPRNSSMGYVSAIQIAFPKSIWLRRLKN